MSFLKRLVHTAQATTAGSDEAVLETMRRLIAGGQVQQAVALFPTLRVFNQNKNNRSNDSSAPLQSQALVVLLSALESVGDDRGLRRVGRMLSSKTLPGSTSSSSSSSASSLRLVLDRVRLQTLRLDPPRAAQAAHAAAAAVMSSTNTTSSTNNNSASVALRIEAVRALLAVRNPDAAFLALEVLQSLPESQLESKDVAPLVVKFLKSSDNHHFMVWAEAGASVETHSPAYAVSCYRKMLYTLQTARNNEPIPHNSSVIAQRSAAISLATRAVMKALADFSALETATGLAAEAFGVFRSKSIMTENGLDGAFLSQCVQTGYFHVIQSVLANANESTLSKNGTTVSDVLDLATLYIDNVVKNDTAIINVQDYQTSQEAFKRIFQMYLHCIPLDSVSAMPTYTVEGAITFLNLLKTKGYSPALPEYHSLMSLLSKPYVPSRLGTFKSPTPSITTTSISSPPPPTKDLSREVRTTHLKNLLQSIQVSGLKPTPQTYTHLLTACTVDFTHRTTNKTWSHSLLERMTHQDCLPHTYGSATTVLKLHLQDGQFTRATHLISEMKAAGIQVGTAAYNIVLKSSTGKASVGAKRFCGYILSDLMHDMDRERVGRDAETWYYLMKACLVAHDLVNARAILAAMKEERGGVVLAGDVKMYEILIRLIFMEPASAKLFGREFVAEVRGAGVFGSSVRYDVMKGVVDYYVKHEEGKLMVDAELLDDILGVTDFAAGLKGGGETVTQRKENVRTLLLGAMESAKLLKQK
ncbi:UNVERIFIED_CONTAM: hypothetical protein HDU68_003763 [Siphonaria sp. JEL0065]|nr:hypothetical protein HDU68_003763 [Siphonaria sp. JEL0065]